MFTKSSMILLALACTLALFACEPEVETLVLASEFNQACTFDGECQPVTEGDTCECHVCPNAAVHEDELAAFFRALNDRRCPKDIECPAIGCGDEFVGVCSPEDLCTLRKAVHLRADDYDQSCTRDDDCEVVFFGEVCDPCRCPNGAINKGAVAAYQADRGDPVCRNNVVCGCIYAEAACESGTCIARH